MTLRVRIKNEGNQPDDALMIRGVRVTGEKNGESPEGLCIYIDTPGTETITLGQGQEAILSPSCGHFDDFDIIQVKGKQ